MATDDFFRARLDTMIDLRHPLAVLARQLPWDRIEQALAPKFSHQDRPAKAALVADLLGERALEFGGGISNAGRPRLSIRLMASLLYVNPRCTDRAAASTVSGHLTTATTNVRCTATSGHSIASGPSSGLNDR